MDNSVIETVLSGALAYAQSMNPWEGVAVLLSIAYLILAVRQSQWCWYAAFGSTAIYSWLFYDVSLVMESALNVYYLGMAIFGWWSWRAGKEQPKLAIQRWSAKQHLLALSAIGVMTAVSGYLLAQKTQAALPYLDSFTTWGAVLTTWMVTRKVLENWIYWLVIDSLAIILYIDREYYLTALLMVVYIVLIVIGWFNWLSQYRTHNQQELQN